MAKGNEILFKIPPKTKALWSKTAAGEQLTLKAWICETLNAQFDFMLQPEKECNDESSMTVIRFTVPHAQKAYWLYQAKLENTKLVTWITSKLGRAVAVSRYMKKHSI